MRKNRVRRNNPFRILTVDDDQIMTSTIQAYFQRNGENPDQRLPMHCVCSICRSRCWRWWRKGRFPPVMRALCSPLMTVAAAKPVVDACPVGAENLPIRLAALLLSLGEMCIRDRDKGEAPFLVLSDGIEDPHNLGAVMRSALLCGAHGIVIPKRGGASVTPTVILSLIHIW